MTDLEKQLAKALRKLQARLDPYDYPDEQEDAHKALAAYDAELAATPAVPEAQQAGEQALPPYTSERHFALREAHCIKDGDDYYAARSHLGENVQRRATFDAGYVRGFDRATELVSARATLAATPTASLTPEWLWSKLMDWCRQRGMNPAEHNALFRIVSESRKLAATPTPEPLHSKLLRDGRRDAAEATLKRLGYEWRGDELWAPPTGKAPALAATPAAAAEPFTGHAREIEAKATQAGYAAGFDAGFDAGFESALKWVKGLEGQQ